MPAPAPEPEPSEPATAATAPLPDEEEEPEEDNFSYESIFRMYDGYGHPNEAEEGTHQWVYWTDGIEIHRRMQGGVWRYETEDDVENKEEYGR